MAKKKREERSVGEPTTLKHNPFAALARADIAPPAPRTRAASADQAEQKPTDQAEQKPTGDSGVTSGVPRADGAAQVAATTTERERVPTRAATREDKPRAKSAGRLVLRRETKGRGGKAVIIVTGFSALASFSEAATLELAQKLKQQLGCGGTVEAKRGEREIILQGDRAAKVAELLRSYGFRVDGVTS